DRSTLREALPLHLWATAMAQSQSGSYSDAARLRISLLPPSEAHFATLFLPASGHRRFVSNRLYWFGFYAFLRQFATAKRKNLPQNRETVGLNRPRPRARDGAPNGGPGC